ncbi:hypothetical protein CXB51_005089 [Gossypium anomalum]|uniref:anthranilate synthase n=1 Tax=Gossypium anomalum TaxID=47600 RepID=A0A8J6D7P0_9ROSI|nr:hypothetical protein CXB51_005089 [Gossypium anomalum]
MAANFITHLSLVHPKPSLSAKSLQNPSLSHLSKLSPSSSLSLSLSLVQSITGTCFFLPIKRSGVVGKLSFASAVADSTSSIPEDKKISKNPIIVIDNYDSFTYNLCQGRSNLMVLTNEIQYSTASAKSLYVGELGCHFEVYRNDELTVEELKMRNPRGVLISPGPGTPQDSGISLQTVLELGPIVPLFGVCMGLQCIGEAFGGKIIRSPYGVMHGKSSLVYHDEKGEDGLLAGLSKYALLLLTFPGEALEVTAWTEDGLIMAARHKVYKHVQGVQFHPESIITWEGKTIREKRQLNPVVNSAHNWLSSKCQIWGWESTLEIHHLCIWTKRIYPSNLVLG